MGAEPIKMLQVQHQRIPLNSIFYSPYLEYLFPCLEKHTEKMIFTEEIMTLNKISSSKKSGASLESLVHLKKGILEGGKGKEGNSHGLVNLKQIDCQLFFQQKKSLFRISKELQFGVCNYGMNGEDTSFIEGKGSWEGHSKQTVHGFSYSDL